MKVTTDGCLFGAWVSKEMQRKRTNNHLLDIGTGTGLLSLMIAQKNQTKIASVEIEEAAAMQAGENVSASPWSSQIEVFYADIKQWETEKKYNTIVSNPPFYEAALRSDNSKKNIAHHDVGLKLDELFVLIADYLIDDGNFYLLLPVNREKEIDGLMLRHRFFLSQKIFVRQTVNHDPFRLMIEGRQKENGATSLVQEMSIKDDQGNYTPEFISLLKDYYFYL